MTPDPVEILARFSDRYEIDYPMLSDRGGVVVEQYGILNPNIPRDHPIQAAGMRSDWSWARTAHEYDALYEALTGVAE